MLFFCLRVDVQETKGTGSFRKFRNALLADYYSKQDILPAQVSAHVFVGSFGATQNKHRLLELGITRILCLSPILPHPFPQEFTYTRFGLKDLPTTDLKECIDFSIAFIEKCVEAGEKVLIHCSAGKSRSIAIVTAYVMHSEKVPFQQAYNKVCSARPQAQMNSGFVKQLKLLDKEWQLEIRAL